MNERIRTGMIPNEKARKYDDDLISLSSQIITDDQL